MNLDSCLYCSSPIAWTTRTVGGHVCLDPDAVELETAHPDAPLYALTRSGAAAPARDLYRPPAAVYVAHRCPQYRDALHAVDALNVVDELEAWVEAIPPGNARRRLLRAVS